MIRRGRPAGSAPTILLIALVSSACHATPKPQQVPSPRAERASASPGRSLRQGRRPRRTVVQLQQDIDTILAQPALDARLLGCARQIAEDRRCALRAQPGQADDARVEHENRDAGRGRRAPGMGLHIRDEAARRRARSISARSTAICSSSDPATPASAPTTALPERVFDGWAERLKAQGVRTILGRIIGDDNTFDDQELGFGWSWDDLLDDYAAGVSALQFNENAARVTVSPGAAAGDLALVSVSPPRQRADDREPVEDRRRRTACRRSSPIGFRAPRDSRCAARCRSAPHRPSDWCRWTTRRCFSSAPCETRSSPAASTSADRLSTSTTS